MEPILTLNTFYSFHRTICQACDGLLQRPSPAPGQCKSPRLALKYPPPRGSAGRRGRNKSHSVWRGDRSIVGEGVHMVCSKFCYTCDTEVVWPGGRRHRHRAWCLGWPGGQHLGKGASRRSRRSSNGVPPPGRPCHPVRPPPAPPAAWWCCRGRSERRQGTR